MTKSATKTIPAGAIADIIAGLNEVLAPLDADRMVRAQEWAKRRCAAYIEWKNSDEAQAIRNNSWAWYPKAFAVAGGKAWWNLFQYGYSQHVADFMVKNCAAGVAKRNFKIASNLAKAGVTSVISSEYARTDDGFDGFFLVETNQGAKRVTITTIYAGGYNIQCLHVRVLVKVR